MNVPTISLRPYWHYQISRVIGWMQRIPVFGKPASALLQLMHVAVVYQQLIEEGKQEWKRKNVKTAIRKSGKVKPNARIVT